MLMTNESKKYHVPGMLSVYDIITAAGIKPVVPDTMGLKVSIDTLRELSLVPFSANGLPLPPQWWVYRNHSCVTLPCFSR